jgi:DNA-binding MarR family transcriptional regulator
VQATAWGTPSETQALADDLFAVVIFLHKNCTPALFEAVGTLELTITQIKLLHHLDEAPATLTFKEASELVLLSLPAISRTVDDLVRRGFVERNEDHEDRRMKRITLTDAGRDVIQRLQAARLHGLKEFVETLSGSERRALSGALSKLNERPEVAACRPGGQHPSPEPEGVTA